MMLKEVEDINREIDRVLDKDKLDDVDYIGVDVVKKGLSEIKTYYLNNNCLEIPEMASTGAKAFLGEMLKNELVGLIVPVIYKDAQKVERYDLGLSKRSNKGMLKLFDILKRNTSLFDYNKDEIIRMSRMNAVPGEDYDFAALYFLGVTFKDNSIDVLKCYYITRIEYHDDTCLQAEQFNDKCFFEYIRSVSNRYFNILLDIYEKLYEELNLHLYIAAVDYFNEGKKKYKIYLKVNENFTEIINNLEKSNKISHLCKKLHEVDLLLKKQADIYIDLLGLCIDTDMNVSTNLFFRFRKRVGE